MKSISISGSKREHVGKKYTKLLRRQGKVPCILYGGEQQLLFSVDENSFKKLVYTPDLLTAMLDIEGKQHNAILKEVQFHPVSDKIIHADFLELFDDRKITVNIPVKCIGDSIGVLEGGQLIVNIRRLKVRALPNKIPDVIEVNIENIKIGDSVKVADLEVEDIEFLDPPNGVVLRVKAPRELIEVKPPVGEVEEGEEEAVKEGKEEEEKKEGEQGKPGEKPQQKPEGKPGGVPSEASKEQGIEEEKGKKKG